jgi:hypothetical protein
MSDDGYDEFLERKSNFDFFIRTDYFCGTFHAGITFLDGK